MATNKLAGTGVALVTPFTELGAIDFDGLERLLHHVSGHVNYLVVLGTTGEAATLNKHERRDVLRFIRQHNRHNLPLVLGLGGNNTAELLHDIKETDFEGISAVLSVSPYYSKPSQAGIIKHYETLADAVPVPVILYNVPGRTGSNMEAATTLTLARHPNIMGIKEASGNLEQAMAIAAGMPEDFLLISGDDMLTVPMISIGASGVISVLANAVPQPFCQMVNQALAGQFAPASTLLYQLLELNRHMYVEGNPVGVKALLEMNGVCGPWVRLPLMPSSQNLKNQIKKSLVGFLQTA